MSDKNNTNNEKQYDSGGSSSAEIDAILSRTDSLFESIPNLNKLDKIEKEKMSGSDTTTHTPIGDINDSEGDDDEDNLIKDIDTNASSLLRSKKNDANDDKITATHVLQNSRELKANEEVPNDSYVYIIQNQATGWEYVQVIESRASNSGQLYLKLNFNRENDDGEESILNGYWFGKEELSLRVPLITITDPDGPTLGSTFPSIVGCISEDFIARKGRCSQ